MPKYKCSDSKCSNKIITSTPGFCPECGAKLVKKSSNTLIYGIFGVGGIIIILFIIGMITVLTNPVSINNSTDISNQTQTTTTPTYAIFENEYITFNYPKDWTVKDNSKNGLLNVNITSSTIRGGSFHVYPLNVFESNYPGEETTLQNLASNIQSEGGYEAGLDEISVAGTKGLEYSPLSENRAGVAYYNLYLQKGEDFYILTIPTTEYGADTEGINLIVNSLQFK